MVQPGNHLSRQVAAVGAHRDDLAFRLGTSIGLLLGTAFLLGSLYYWNIIHPQPISNDLGLAIFFGTLLGTIGITVGTAILLTSLLELGLALFFDESLTPWWQVERREQQEPLKQQPLPQPQPLGYMPKPRVRT